MRMMNTGTGKGSHVEKRGVEMAYNNFDFLFCCDTRLYDIKLARELTIGIFLGQCRFRHRVFAETWVHGSTIVGHFCA